MFTFGYTRRKSRILKAVVVLVMGLLLLGTRRGFFIIIGGVFVFIAIRDLMVIAREKQVEEKRQAPREERTDRPSSDNPGDGKIQITDLSDAKEVDFTKE